jgi:single-stranded DNA-binding protein
MQLIDSKGGDPASSGQQNSGQSRPQISQQTSPAPQVTQVSNGLDNFDDDIPF